MTKQTETTPEEQAELLRKQNKLMNDPFRQQREFSQTTNEDRYQMALEAIIETVKNGSGWINTAFTCRDIANAALKDKKDD